MLFNNVSMVRPPENREEEEEEEEATLSLWKKNSSPTAGEIEPGSWPTPKKRFT